MPPSTSSSASTSVRGAIRNAPRRSARRSTPPGPNATRGRRRGPGRRRRAARRRRRHRLDDHGQPDPRGGGRDRRLVARGRARPRRVSVLWAPARRRLDDDGESEQARGLDRLVDGRSRRARARAGARRRRAARGSRRGRATCRPSRGARARRRPLRGARSIPSSVGTVPAAAAASRRGRRRGRAPARPTRGRRTTRPVRPAQRRGVPSELMITASTGLSALDSLGRWTTPRRPPPRPPRRAARRARCTRVTRGSASTAAGRSRTSRPVAEPSMSTGFARLASGGSAVASAATVSSRERGELEARGLAGVGAEDPEPARVRDASRPGGRAASGCGENSEATSTSSSSVSARMTPAC